MTGTPPSLDQRIELGLRSLGVIHPADTLSTEHEPPLVVVERLDAIKKWAEALIRAEVSRELDEFGDRIERHAGRLSRDQLIEALHERADDLRTGEVTP